MSAAWLYLRLALALAVVLAPGWAIARAVGVRGVASTLAWALAAIFAAMGATFLVHGSIALVLALLGVLAAAALVLARPGRAPFVLGLGSPGALAVGLVVGLLLWHVAGEIGGDGLFHLARARKLLELGDLSPGAVNEFPDGGLHPGYAFPLWHGLLALVAFVASTDPANVVLHLPSLLAPVAVLVWAEAGWSLFRRRAAALATAAVAVVLAAFAPLYGGAYTALALPATASRQLLVPVALALAFACVRSPRPALLTTAGAASFALAVVHPTYAVFLWIPFAGFVLVRAIWTRHDLRAGAIATAALMLPAAAFVGALAPVVAGTASVSPGQAERARAFDHYAGQLRGTSDRFAVVPDLFGRSGTVAVVALLLAPLAVLAARRRWAAYVVGGGLAVAAITLVPFLFTPFSDVVSVSQARRLVGFFPFAAAVVGGLGVLAPLLGPLLPAGALAAGIVFRLVVPGDFGYRLDAGGPAWVTWASLAGLVAALGGGLAVRRSLERTAGLAVGLLVLPTVVASLVHWSPSAARQPSALSPGLLAEVARSVPERGVIYSDPEASYRLAAFAPVRICVAPPGHVADTTENRPRARVDAFRRFVRTGDLAIPRACGAGWLVVDRSRFPGLRGGALLYRDARWEVWRV